jgi:transposase-like protein
MANKNRSAEKEEFWRLVFREFEASGETVREFCRREGIAVPSFYGWRRKIAQRDGAHKNASPGLVPVSVVNVDGAAEQAPAHASGGGGRIEIVTPSGLTLRVDEAVETKRLKEVLRAIVGLDDGAARC